MRKHKRQWQIYVCEEIAEDMKKISILALIVFAAFGVRAQNTFENDYSRPLGEVLDEISARYRIKLKYNVDTTGLRVKHADSRVRLYSADESLANVLAPFDMKAVKQHDSLYKIKYYESHVRLPEDGAKMLAWLSAKYDDCESFENRRDELRRDVRKALGLDEIMAQRVEGGRGGAPMLSRIRRYDGYAAQNFAIETLEGLYVCGTLYIPLTAGPHPVILCPNGHFEGGRYCNEQQLRLATLARMGAVCASYDLFGYGESELQVGPAAHHTSVAHVVQAMNGLTVLDMLLARPDADTTRVGVNGGSGGGTQTILLGALDERFTASCPVISMSSYFDGGCPCESGLPVVRAAGGTCNAELAALMAPKPLHVISDGEDWTASTPWLEYPYLKRIYNFYKMPENVTNDHFTGEGHDFGENKRTAVYRFFGRTFGLDMKAADESRVTIEPVEAMCSFGGDGEMMPEGAVRSVGELAKYFGEESVRKAAADESVMRKAQQIVGELKLADREARTQAVMAVYNHRRAVRDWHNAHPYTTVPEVDPATGAKRSKVEREMLADLQIPASVHRKLVDELSAVLTPEQVEQVFDGYTVGKVAFTMKGYRDIVPDLTDEEAAFIEGHLKQAREEALECKNMQAISQVFKEHKKVCEKYLDDNGRSWRALYQAHYDRVQAEKKAAQADKDYVDKSAQIVAALGLDDAAKAEAVTEIVRKHRQAVVDWHNSHPYTDVPETEARTGRKLSEVEREMTADRQIPARVRGELMKGLRKHLTDGQIEQIMDGYTVGKVAFTMQGYRAIVPDLTATEAAALEGNLKRARAESLECRRMKSISQVFEIYKTRCEEYLNNHGRNWRELFKAYVDRINAEKAAKNNE